VSLREHLEEIIQLRFNAMDAAVKLAAKEAGERHAERSNELDRHLNELNNSHRQAKEKEVEFARRVEVELAFEKVKDRIAGLEKLAAVAVFMAMAVPFLVQLLQWWSRHP